MKSFVLKSAGLRAKGRKAAAIRRKHHHTLDRKKSMARKKWLKSPEGQKWVKEQAKFVKKNHKKFYKPKSIRNKK